MKPAPGHYRLSSPGAPDMDAYVSMVGMTTTLDVFDWVPAQGAMVARERTLMIECTGLGTFIAFVGTQPGFVVNGTCVKLA